MAGKSGAGGGRGGGGSGGGRGSGGDGTGGGGGRGGRNGGQAGAEAGDRAARRAPTPRASRRSTRANGATRERIAIVAGLRTPFCRAGTALATMRTVDLAVACVKELVARSDVDPKLLELCVYGQVVPSVDWLNIAREVVLGAGLPRTAEAYSVSRACATSIQAMTDAALSLAHGHHEAAVVGGADSTTDVPLKVSPKLRDALLAAQRAKTMGERLRALASLSPRDLVPGEPGFTREPATGERMGEAAEKMAKLNGIDRETQDRIALRSHERAAHAWREGLYAPEVMPLFPPPFDTAVEKDNIVRDDASYDALAALEPVFDKRHGTITAGNSSPLTDGASALLLMREPTAKALGYEPLGYLKSWAYAAVDPGWQLLMAPVFAAPLALERAGLGLADMALVEVHEAFAAQVASNLQALASERFCQERLGRPAVGDVDPDRLNVAGGSIALGHPFAATGARMVLTALGALGRRGGGHALLTLCAAGGLGAAVVLEVEP
jgi:acetyl-CoA acyltransferase